MINCIRELFHFRDLLFLWSLREIKVRYKQSVVGAGWAILQPLVLMLMFTLVFSVFVRVPSDGIPYPIFSYTAVLPWTFFATGISFAVPSLVNNMNLVTKIYFPREVLPLGSVIAAFVDFLVASVVFGGLLLFYRVPVHASLAWVPLIVATQVVLTLGIVFFAATLNVWFRDIRFVVPLALQLWMYASPVIYPVSLVPERWRPLYLLNPMASLIDSYRRTILLGQPPDYPFFLWAVGLSSALCVVGYAYFKRSEPRFADVI